MAIEAQKELTLVLVLVWTMPPRDVQAVTIIKVTLSADRARDLCYRNVMAVRKKKAGKRRIEVQVWSIKCLVCGDWFKTTSGKATYCSTACKQKAYRDRRRHES